MRGHGPQGVYQLDAGLADQLVTPPLPADRSLPADVLVRLPAGSCFVALSAGEAVVPWASFPTANRADWR